MLRPGASQGAPADPDLPDLPRSGVLAPSAWHSSSSSSDATTAMLPNDTPGASPTASSLQRGQRGGLAGSTGLQATAREFEVQAGPPGARQPSRTSPEDPRVVPRGPARLYGPAGISGGEQREAHAHGWDAGKSPATASGHFLDAQPAASALMGGTTGLRLGPSVHGSSTGTMHRASTPTHSAREAREPADASRKTSHRRGRDEAGLDDSPGASREHKRLRSQNGGRAEEDFRAFMDTEVEHTNGLSRVDFLGFYDDSPTLNMLTDLELFMFNQRQRWFDLGRLHSWNRFEDELARLRQDSSSSALESSPHDALDELREIIRALTCKNQYLSDKLAATESDLSSLQSRAEDGRRQTLELTRRNDDLDLAAKRSSRDVERLSSELRKRDAQLDSLRCERDELLSAASPRASVDSDRLKRIVTNLIEELVAQRWDEEQRRHNHSAPQQYGSRDEWAETFQHRVREELNVKYGSENTVPLWLDAAHGAAERARSLRGSIDLGLAPADVIDAFDPDSTPYDQLDFIEKSLEVERAKIDKQHDALQVLPEPRRIPGHFVWTSEEYNLPVPLGKFGQPHWSGSAWEDFNPIRLWKDVDAGKVERGDELWMRLAEDAVRLPFEFRSNAQRIVASEAHRFKAPTWSKPLLPSADDVAEVDVWNQCVHNALYLPLAIRRQYSYNRHSRTLYREWDAGDLGIYLILRACGPENRSKKEKRAAETGGQRPSKWSSWSEQVRAAFVWADANRDVWQTQLQKNERAGNNIEHTRPRRYSGSGDPADVFLHLFRCGFNADRMVRPGDVYAYVERAEFLEAKLQQFKNQVTAAEQGLSDHNTILARAKCRMEMEDKRIPSGRPLVRCRVKSGDPVAAEHLKMLEDTM